MESLQFQQEGERNKKDFWERVEQVARISAQFAATTAVVGGLLGVIVITSIDSLHAGLRGAERIPVGRFPNLPSPFIEESIKPLAFSYIVVVLGSLSVLYGLIGLGWWCLLNCINRRLKSHAKNIVLLVLVVLVLSGGFIIKFVEELLGLTVLFFLTGITLWVFAFYYRDNQKNLEDSCSSDHKNKKASKKDFKGRKNFASSEVSATRSLYNLYKVSAAFFSFLFLVGWFVAVVTMSKHMFWVEGWRMGVMSVCKSPQVVFERGTNGLSGQTAFLLVHTEAEYYVFTDTITTLPPTVVDDKSIQWLAQFLSPSEGYTSCSPSSLVVLPAADVGAVRILYDKRRIPEGCCSQSFGPTPTPTPAPTPSATPDP